MRRILSAPVRRIALRVASVMSAIVSKRLEHPEGTHLIHADKTDTGTSESRPCPTGYASHALYAFHQPARIEIVAKDPTIPFVATHLGTLGNGSRGAAARLSTASRRAKFPTVIGRCLGIALVAVNQSSRKPGTAGPVRSPVGHSYARAGELHAARAGVSVAAGDARHAKVGYGRRAGFRLGLSFLACVFCACGFGESAARACGGLFLLVVGRVEVHGLIRWGCKRGLGWLFGRCPLRDCLFCDLLATFVRLGGDIRMHCGFGCAFRWSDVRFVTSP